jgi:hypothetical protein
MKIGEMEFIFDNILDRTEKIVRAGNRNGILNEQFYHHQFSALLTRHYTRQRIDPWKDMIIVPGHPTKALYSWREFGLNRPKTTQKLALNRGQAAKFDFVIKDKPRIHVEWAGPNLYDSRSVARDLTKLLMLEGRTPVKVFAAIITSSRRADDLHIQQLTSRFYDALEFVQSILEIDDVRKERLYAYIATVPDSGVQKFIWGRV